MTTPSQKHFRQISLGFSSSPEGRHQVTLTYWHYNVYESSALAVLLAPPGTSPSSEPTKRPLLLRKFDNWNRVVDFTTHELGKRSVMKLVVLLEDYIREYLEEVEQTPVPGEHGSK